MLQRRSVILAIFFVTGIVLLTTLAMGQAWRGRGRVKGVVTDTAGNPLEGVVVRLFHVSSQSGFEVKTNAKGEWQANFIRGGQWHIDFEKPGYAPRKISVNLRGFGRNPSIKIQMEKLEMPTPGVPPELLEKVDEGNRLFDEGKYEEALAVFQSLLEQYPDLKALHFNIGNTYTRMGQYEKAIEHYRLSLEHHPDKNQVLMAIGNAYLQLRQFDKALEIFDQFELQRITDPNLLYNIGTAYFVSNKLDKAAAVYERVVELKPDFLDALYMLGTAYVGLGEKTKARAILERYLQYDSTSERAREVRMIIKGIKK